MNNIELTEEHKTKLLEMCRELFPEYNRFIGFYKTEDELFYKEKIYKFNMLHLIGEDDNIQIIHWFEFCMTHLIEKLNDLSDVYEEIPPYVANVYGGANGKWNLYVKFHFHYPKNRYKKHPIDYLYSEFLKLSK